jgi:hypothetical protein
MLSRFGRTRLPVVACVLAAGLTGAMFAVPASNALPLQASWYVAAQAANTPVNPTAVPIPASRPVGAQPPSAPVDSKPTNPVVEPGKVQWHATTKAAFAAAKASGKPVLVFHMMGQLDHQFC